MRMAHVMAGAPEGGAELFFERLTAALHAAGDTVLPVIRRNAARAARLHQAGLHPVQLRFGGALDVLTRPHLARTLRSFAPRLVMAWMSRAAAMTPSGDYVLTGRLGGYYDLRRFQLCDHLVANTLGLVRWIETQGWPAGRVHHLPNFSPDLAGAAPAILPSPPGAPIVLAMGRLHRNKAFDVLIRAMPRLPGVHLVLAGEGHERDALLHLAQSEGVADRLHLLGWRTDQAALLAACTVLVCPSRQEPLGNVVLEAFSAGVPVVAAAAEGPLELIRPGQTGLLAPLEDPVALADAIGAVLGDHNLAARLGAAGRTEYEAVHAEASVVARWRTVLASMEQV
jgi:glycosyltransferase involved in cell wall biosynthesis